MYYYLHFRLIYSSLAARFSGRLHYAAFGHVTDGLDVALQIAADAEPVDDNGTILPEAQPVIEYVKVLD